MVDYHLVKPAIRISRRSTLDIDMGLYVACSVSTP